jgi:hypothetical protein
MMLVRPEIGAPRSNPPNIYTPLYHQVVKQPGGTFFGLSYNVVMIERQDVHHSAILRPRFHKMLTRLRRIGKPRVVKIEVKTPED